MFYKKPIITILQILSITLAITPLQGMQQQKSMQDRHSLEFIQRKRHHEKWTRRTVLLYGLSSFSMLAYSRLTCPDEDTADCSWSGGQKLFFFCSTIAACAKVTWHKRSLGLERDHNKKILIGTGVSHGERSAVSLAAEFDTCKCLVRQYEDAPLAVARSEQTAYLPTGEILLNLGWCAIGKVSQSMEEKRLKKQEEERALQMQQQAAHQLQVAEKRDSIVAELNILIGKVSSQTLEKLEPLVRRITDETHRAQLWKSVDSARKNKHYARLACDAREGI